MIKQFPVVNFYGGKARKITDNIYYEIRGEVYTFGGKTILSFGGADSIDKEFRLEGLSWWKEERIFNYDVENAFKNLDKYDRKIDYIVSHTGGTEVCRNLGFKPEESDLMLDKILGEVKYKQRYAGHYHVDKIINSRTRVLFNDIIELLT